MILVDTVYINDSGGKVLLEYFITYLQEHQILSRFYFLLDPRLSSEVAAAVPSIQRTCIHHSEKDRKNFYKENSQRFSGIFCFANVPPPVFVRHKKVYILFHNTLILDNGIAELALTQKLTYWLKKSYIRFRNRPEYHWIVQTHSVKKMVGKHLAVDPANIDILPFYKPFDTYCNQNETAKKRTDATFHFLFVANSSKQKNHIRLLEAFVLAAGKTECKLVLHLTLPEPLNHQLTNALKQANLPNLEILNHGACTHAHIRNLYRRCDFFIFPSLTESFGLPLIEAASLGCTIVAANLAFVHDVVKPSLTFDPMDINCIANAIIQCLGQSLPATELLAENRIQNLIAKIQ